jgi:hypothetical protein
MNDLVLRHWGIQNKKSGGWITSSSGVMFWTTSQAVAEAYLSQQIHRNPDWEVTEFYPPTILSVAEESDSEINNSGKRDNAGHDHNVSGI